MFLAVHIARTKRRLYRFRLHRNDKLEGNSGMIFTSRHLSRRNFQLFDSQSTVNSQQSTVNIIPVQPELILRIGHSYLIPITVEVFVEEVFVLLASAHLDTLAHCNGQFIGSVFNCTNILAASAQAK